MPKYREGEDLLDYIKRIEKRLETMERTSQLANSSIENGALAVNINDGQTQTMQIGVQFDGTSAPVVLVSPTPPAPSTPIVGPALNGITVTWDGTFVGAALTPMDFAYVAVHVGAAGFDPFLTNPVHVFNSPQGGKVFVPVTAATYEVRLITRTLAGTPSVVSAAASGTAGSSVSDGSAPGASPVPIAVGGVGSFFVSWTPVANADPVTYKVYAGTTSGFTANASTLVGTTDASTINARTVNGVQFSYNTDYYFKVIASDADGSAAASAASNVAQMVKITNEYVAASYLYAGDVYANQIRSGLMSADISIAGSFATATGGQRVVMNSFGIRQYGPDGVSIITDLPNDPGQTSKFTGIINAFGMTINNGLELRGQNNVFAMGSITTLATTTSGSPTPPTLTVNWEQVDSGMTEYLMVLRGYHRESDGATPKWISSFFGYTKIHANGFVYQWPEITDINGTKRSNFDGFDMTVVRTATGERAVMYGSRLTSGSGDTFGYRVYDTSTMTADGVAPLLKFENTYGTPGFAIGYIHGRCISPAGTPSAVENQFAQVEHNLNFSPDRLTFRRFAVTDTSITQQGSDLIVNSPLPDGAPGDGVYGVVYGSSARMNFPGTDQNIWLVFTKYMAYAWSAAGARLTDFDFPVMGVDGKYDAVGSTAAGVNGFVRFEGTPFYNDTALKSTRFTNTHWPSTDSSVWWVGYTWYDSNATGGAHETNVSALSSVTMAKRAQLTITTPNLPDPAAGAGTPRLSDDVNSFRTYMQRQASAPTRTQLWQQTAQPADLATTVTYAAMPQWSGTSNPPATTSFPAQASAVVQSSGIAGDGLPKFKFTGDGDFSVDALSVRGVGSASLSGKAFEQLYYSVRAQALLTGGGVLTVSSTFEVKWSAPFRPSSLGRGASLATAGYFEISTPTASTVVNGYGGATNKTVTANGIPLADWDALYYVLPYGSTFTSQNGNFRVVNLSGDFVVPNDWVLICIKNGTSSRIEFTTGDRVPASAIGGGSVFQGPIACSYGSGFTYASDSVNDPPFVYAEGNWAFVSGRVRRSSGTGVTAFVIPSGYRPRPEIIRAYLTVFALGGGNAEGPTFVGDIDPTNGNVDLRATTTVAWTTTTWLSIFGAYPRTLS